jgi:hypothetical protein
MSDRLSQLQREMAARGVGVCVIGPSENLRYGIRIEDTVAITDEGPRRLTRGARDLTARAV